jgi:hypothetical protein
MGSAAVRVATGAEVGGGSARRAVRGVVGGEAVRGLSLEGVHGIGGGGFGDGSG